MLIDLRNLLSGAKDDMTVSAPLEMETFRTALAEYPVMEKQPVELVLTRTGKDKLHISGNGFVALRPGLRTGALLSDWAAAATPV